MPSKKGNSSEKMHMCSIQFRDDCATSVKLFTIKTPFAEITIKTLSGSGTPKEMPPLGNCVNFCLGVYNTEMTESLGQFLISALLLSKLSLQIQIHLFGHIQYLLCKSDASRVF